MDHANSQLVVLTEDTQFVEQVRAAARNLAAPAYPIPQVRQTSHLDASLGIEDVLVVDTRRYQVWDAPTNAAPCPTIYVAGTDDLAAAQLTAQLKSVRRPRTSAPKATAGDNNDADRSIRQSQISNLESQIADPLLAAPLDLAATALDPDAPAAREHLLLSFAIRLASLKADVIVDACRNLLPRIVGARRASGYQYNPGAACLELLWKTHDGPVTDVITLSPFRSDSPMAVAANRRALWIAPDLQRETSARSLQLELPYAANYASDSCIIAPIVSGAELLGVLNFAEPLDRRPFDPDRLGPLLEQLCHLLAASWQAVSTVENLEHLARTDPLTGLGNYRAFEDTLRTEVTRSRRHGLPLSLILLDVDGLKQVNDRCGHPAGDLLLRELGRRIRETVREIDVPTRQGGDEFAVILPNTALTAAQPVATRLDSAVNGVDVRWLRHVFQTSVSMGLGQYDGHSDPDVFMAGVDALLYAAKQSRSPSF